MFGYPNTAASFSMECRPAEGAIELMTIDTAIEADRPVQVSVGRSLLRTRERLDPPDVYAISRIAVPLAHPLVRAFASGEGPIVVSAEGERFEVPEGSLPRQMVRDCLRQRFR